MQDYGNVSKEGCAMDFMKPYFLICLLFQRKHYSFFTNFPQYKNVSISNFGLAVLLKINSSNKTSVDGM